MAQESSRRIIAGGAIVLVIVIAGVLVLLFNQRDTIAAEREVRAAKLLAGPRVKVVKASLSEAGYDITLIGEVRPYQSVTLYAKTSGYMDKILVDKGDSVTKGQVIATLVAPEIDQEYNSAVADLENKRRILKRDESLLEKKYISPQEKELSETAVRIAQARLKSITEQQEYRIIRAPFDGTVTARYADPGALLQNAANASTGALPIVMVSQLDKVRIYAYVEQKDASVIKVGTPADIVFYEAGNEKISTALTRIAGELDPKTRMMLTEIDLDNKDHKVLPGSFVQVRIHLPGQPKLQIPREALIIREGKFFVATVTATGTLHFQSIKIGDNNGERISVMEGLSEGQVIALHIGDSQEEGQKVIVQP